MLRVVVVAYKNGDWLDQLLNSLKKFVGVPFEVVLWDNGGLKSHCTQLKEKFEGSISIILAGNGKNLGFSKAVNEAAKIKSQTTWTDLFLINPDAYLLSPLGTQEFEKYKALNGICGLAVFDDPEKKVRQSSARSFPGMWMSMAGREGWLTRLWPNNPISARYLGKHLTNSQNAVATDWVSGSALLCPRKVWESLKGFHEEYFLYVEDVDLCQKAKQTRIPVFYFPLVEVCHQIRGSSEGQVNWKADAYHHWGMWIYHSRWSGFFGFLGAPFVFIGILARFLLRRVFS